jgi:hypothetical protein
MNTTEDQAVEELARAIYDADLSADWQKPLDGYHAVAATLIAAGWTKGTPA